MIGDRREDQGKASIHLAKVSKLYSVLMNPRLYRLFLLGAFLLAIAAGSYTSYRSFQKELREAIQNNKTAANLVSSLILANQKRIAEILQSYSRRPLLIRATCERNFNEALTHLTNLKESHPDLGSVFITDLKGILWVNVPVQPENLGRDYSFREWFQETSRDLEPYVSGVYRRMSGGQDLSISVSVPIFDEKGNAVGILTAPQPVRNFEKIIDPLRLDPDIKITLVDKPGGVIYSNQSFHRKAGKAIPLTDLVAKAQKGESGEISLRDPSDGGRVKYVAYTPIKGIGWSLIVQKGRREVLQSMVDEFIPIFLVSVLFFLSIFLLLANLKKGFLTAQMAGWQKANEAIEKNEEQLRLITDSLPLFVSYIDAGHCYRFVNKHHEKWFGPCGEIIGKHIQEIIGKEVYEETKSEVERALSGEEVVFEKAMLYKFVGPHYTRTHLIPHISENGKVLGLIALVSDITRKKKAEEELRRAYGELEIRVEERTAELSRANHSLQVEIDERKRAEGEIKELNENLKQRAREVEATNRELEAFSYSVSHDLRAPLRGIEGFSQALFEDCFEKLDDQGKEFLRRIRGATQRMGQLIDDLLRLSRLTRNELQFEEVDLSAMANRISRELQEREAQRQVEWVIEPGLRARGDGRLLRVMLENLLGNAWKFTGKHPRGRIDFGVVHSGNGPAYFVRDDGGGFDMAYADKLFAPFQRLHNPKEFPGTGIGLATVRRIVHRHGGRIWAEGEVEKGAAFYFTLGNA